MQQTAVPHLADVQTDVQRFSCFSGSVLYGLCLLTNRFIVLFQVLCNGWQKLILSTRNGFVLLFYFSFILTVRAP